HLELPSSTSIELHVTSLDVTHSFWAYELGVKADAVPGADNIVFVHPRRTGSFSIRCAELCGLWHGHMFQTGQVVSGDQFKAWIAQQQAAGKLNHKYLPPYSRSYYPEPTRRAGKEEEADEPGRDCPSSPGDAASDRVLPLHRDRARNRGILPRRLDRRPDRRRQGLLARHRPE